MDRVEIQTRHSDHDNWKLSDCALVEVIESNIGYTVSMTRREVITFNTRIVWSGLCLLVENVALNIGNPDQILLQCSVD